MNPVRIDGNKIHDMMVDLVSNPNTEWQSTGDVLVINKLGKIIVYRFENALSPEEVIEVCKNDNHRHCDDIWYTTMDAKEEKCEFCKTHSGWSRKTDNIESPKFKVGDSVEKTSGDYRFDGTIVAVFRKRNGIIRYCVEDDRGLLFIFNENSLHLKR